jgi:hypothetical protein
MRVLLGGLGLAGGTDGGTGRAGGALGLDQLGEPPDLALHGLESVLLELEGVAVEACPGASE